MKSIEIGMKVRFGAYGEQPDEKIYTIKQIIDGTFCKEYILQGNGTPFTAYEDEIFPI